MDEINDLRIKGENEIKEGEKMVAAGREKLQKVEELTKEAKAAQGK
ncbi:MAG TPA: hypothetical protein VJB37_02865 [Patescibacteria group bacterium]|nr:hypothetical protein [Patescibacteria group bacterium]